MNNKGFIGLISIIITVVIIWLLFYMFINSYFKESSQALLKMKEDSSPSTANPNSELTPQAQGIDTSSFQKIEESTRKKIDDITKQHIDELDKLDEKLLPPQ